MAQDEGPGLHQPPSERETDLHVAAFFDLSTDMLCLADFQGYFIRLNPSWERVLGYPREELLGRRS
jgi:PAS domain S-box-containing protein